MHLLVHVFGAVFHELSLWRNTRAMDDSQAAMASQPESSGQPMADAPHHLCHIIFRDEIVDCVCMARPLD